MFRPPPAARAATAAVTLCLVLVLAACGSSGREMREPERDVTSPTRSVPTTVAPLSLPSLPLGTGVTESTFPPAPPGVFDISSSAFAAGGDLPATYTCAGPSPALRWQAVPEGTAELALVVTEQGDGGDVYWMVTGISTTGEGVAEGEVPVGAVQLPNSLGEAAWAAPCPPPGESLTFNVALLALPQPAAVPAGTPATDAYRLLTEQAAGDVAILTGTATR
jgi:phosphatidylethanolamine-binding protein (PEBP) family uncharacterized protein